MLWLLGAPLVAGVFTVGLTESMETVATESLPASSGVFKKAAYVDVMVISEKPSEGVVRRVRAFPDGRTDAAPWDAFSNAPGS